MKKPHCENASIAARNLAVEINLLRRFNIPSKRIAELFQTTDQNIRQIIKRSQFPEELPFALPSEPIRYSIREQDRIYGMKRKKLEEQERLVEELFSDYSSSYQFGEGSKVLRSLLAEISAPTHPRRMRLRARVHHHLAWFAVQQGHCRTAIKNAEMALSISREVYKRTWDSLDLNRYVETSLVLSMATHLSVQSRVQSRERLSLEILEVAREAAAAANNPRGSEHYRQIGSALFHLGHESEAHKQLLEAREAAMEKGEAQNESQADVLVGRHLNLIGTPNWEGAQELLANVQTTFGAGSLQYAIHANYAAATALLTKSGNLEADAIELLQRDADLIDQSGRQATVRKLLSITLELKLDQGPRRIWVTHALRANGLHNL
jgi:tetratricopeptide (TPR) repeat protein